MTPAELLACQAALATVAADQAAALQALSTAERLLLATAGSSAAGGSGAGGYGGSGAGSTSGTGVNAGTAVSTASPTADPVKVAQAKAQVLQAEQALTTAQNNAAAATLTAPITGTVAKVGLAAGAMSAGSVTIIGDGSAEVAVEIPLATRPLVTVGQPALVTPPGSNRTLTGTVNRINTLETTGTTGAPTYTTVIVVDDGAALLPDGSKAETQVAVRTVTDVVTVPVSALTPVAAGQGSVKVLDGTTVTTRTVATGAIGGGLIEITAGLEAGTVVVLADRTQSIPANINAFRPQSASATTSAATAKPATPQPTPTR